LKLFEKQKEIVDHYYIRDDDNIQNSQDGQDADSLAKGDTEAVEAKEAPQEDPQDNPAADPAEEHRVAMTKEANTNLVNVNQPFEKSYHSLLLICPQMRGYHPPMSLLVHGNEHR
jgi:hypothetical protein